MKKIALFPGSFDPLTNGHIEIIERSGRLFDEVIVAIMTNTAKAPLFSSDEKELLVTEALQHLANVKIISRSSGLTVDLAKEVNANFLVRGIRNVLDYEYEKNIAHMNESLDHNIESVFLLSSSENSKLSSSMVKEIASFGGDVSSFLPKVINDAIINKYSARR